MESVAEIWKDRQDGEEIRGTREENEIFRERKKILSEGKTLQKV